MEETRAGEIAQRFLFRKRCASFLQRNMHQEQA